MSNSIKDVKILIGVFAIVIIALIVHVKSVLQSQGETTITNLEELQNENKEIKNSENSDCGCS